MKISILSFPLVCLLIYACQKGPFASHEVQDYDGNTYKTVILGDQVWMAENLRATHFSNGDSITLIVSDGEWIHATEAGYAKFMHSDSLVDIYGLHYNWYAAVDPRGICPKGWHVPSYEEWKELRTFLGGDSIAGGALKETGTIHWLDNAGATNSSEMAMLPGGYRSYSNGWSNSLGIIGFWWTSTGFEDQAAISMAIRYYGSYLYKWNDHKRTGACIRCMKD